MYHITSTTCMYASVLCMYVLYTVQVHYIQLRTTICFFSSQIKKNKYKMQAHLQSLYFRD